MLLPTKYTKIKKETTSATQTEKCGILSRYVSFCLNSMFSLYVIQTKRTIHAHQLLFYSFLCSISLLYYYEYDVNSKEMFVIQPCSLEICLPSCFNCALPVAPFELCCRDQINCRNCLINSCIFWSADEK